MELVRLLVTRRAPCLSDNRLYQNAELPLLAEQAALCGQNRVLHAVPTRPRRGSRDTRHLRCDQAVNLLNAWAFAEHSRTPLDLHVVVHWDRLDLVAGPSILAAQSAFLDRLSKWLHKRGKPMAYLWTIEFGLRKGTHTHLLLSVRRLHARTAGELFRSLPKLLTGKDNPLPAEVVKVEFNRMRLPHAPERNGRIAQTEAQRRGLMAYLCKGLHPDAAAATGINPEDQGEVRFRRCGVSRSLDWAARRRAGWTEYPLEHFDFADLAEKRRNGIASALYRHAGAPGATSASRAAIPSWNDTRARTPLGGVSGELSQA